MVAILIIQLLFSVFILAVLIDAFLFFRKYPQDIQRLEFKLNLMEKMLKNKSRPSKQPETNNNKPRKKEQKPKTKENQELSKFSGINKE